MSSAHLTSSGCHLLCPSCRAHWRGGHWHQQQQPGPSPSDSQWSSCWGAVAAARNAPGSTPPPCTTAVCSWPALGTGESWWLLCTHCSSQSTPPVPAGCRWSPPAGSAASLLEPGTLHVDPSLVPARAPVIHTAQSGGGNSYRHTPRRAAVRHGNGRGHVLTGRAPPCTGIPGTPTSWLRALARVSSWARLHAAPLCAAQAGVPRGSCACGAPGAWPAHAMASLMPCTQPQWKQPCLSLQL